MSAASRFLTIVLAIICAGQAAVAAESHFTPDFGAFLAQNFPNEDFSARAAGIDSGFGGKTDASDTVERTPVVFVHGMADRAFGGESGGWATVIGDFLARGYKARDLYALTWGKGTQSSAVQSVHDAETVLRVRRFLEAVLAYTDAPRIHVIGHSMGVTLARRAIKGGRLENQALGTPLTDRVDTFIGIAGANSGVGSCLNPFAEFLPMCSRVNGLHPESDYLAALNADPTREGGHVYAFWSSGDEVLNGTVIGRDNPVPARVTAKIAGEDGEYGFEGLSHVATRDATLATQRELIP